MAMAPGPGGAGPLLATLVILGAGHREETRSFPMQPANPSNMPSGVYPPYPTAPAYGAPVMQNYPMQPGYAANTRVASYQPYPPAPAYNAASAPPYTSS
ncbi:comitin-like isoform X2 [Stegostoma tigrinum]|uniref:comitin-like isoform X2 n=1 Tax=Stegostoma tigrinum TaxID=3053191 RepID=UPI00202B1CEC|nr:comitin-like isoform X2 [Stegostoma tigrinum]